mmetsp:Transcript_41686/g.67636  ORF Transcript_41686/g.67636 Transcript_41686/m.67636 type:complete len:160 (-) Transcript_41686:176-655(-)
MGLSGIALYLLSRGETNVLLTDQLFVLPLLQVNVDANIRLCKESAGGGSSLGKLEVAEHLWGSDISSLGAPYDIILCADCVYKADLVAPLMKSLISLSSTRSILFVAMERRDPSVADLFLSQAALAFRVKKIAWKGEESEVEIYRLKKKPDPEHNQEHD